MDTSKMRMFGIVSSAVGPSSGAGGGADDLRPVIRTFYDHVGTVTSLAFHPRQPMLFTGSTDKTVKVFDLTRGGINKKALYSISDVSPVNVVAPHPCGDYVFVGTCHPVIRMYDIHTQSCFSAYHQSNHHTGAITDLKTSSDGSAFVSTSMDGNIQFWDGINNRVANRLVGAHSGQPVYSCQWSRNNRYVLTTGGDHRARLWDVRTGKQLLVYAANPNSMNCEYMSAQFLHNEDYVLVCSSEYMEADVTVFDTRTGSVLIPKLGIHQNTPCRCIAASPTDKTFLTGGDDFKVRYVDISVEGGDEDMVQE
jgi:cleavage stimulation factor subunit 1